jgi:hypothetical protein
VPRAASGTRRAYRHARRHPVPGVEYGRRPHRCLQSGKITFPAAVSLDPRSCRERRDRRAQRCRERPGRAGFLLHDAHRAFS